MYESEYKACNQQNEFILVGEWEKEGTQFYQLQHLGEDGIKLIGGIKIDRSAYLVEKKDVILQVSNDYIFTELDIPKEYLTMDVIESIQRLNA